MLSKKRTRKWIWIATFGVALLGLVYALLFWLLPYWQAENTMDANQTVAIETLENGQLQVNWQSGKNAQFHTLEIFDLEQDNRLLFSNTTVGQCSCILPELPADRPLLLRISSGHNYGNNVRMGEQYWQGQLVFDTPELQQLRWTVNPDTDEVQIDFALGKGESCDVYKQISDAQPQLLEQSDAGNLTIAYADAIPAHGVTELFTFQISRKQGNTVFTGPVCEGFSVTREDFLGDTLTLESVALEQNAYSLSWNETKGKAYLLEYSADGGNRWQSLASIEAEAERVYTTEHLLPFREYQFRVSAVEPSAPVTPAVCQVSTVQRTLYATIWPLMDLQVYADLSCTQPLGTAPAGTAYCVIAEEDGLFGIRYGDKTGYIDSNYCMINLPEYMGTLCAYDITNSYSSLYMVHDFPMQAITDTVITGYQSVQLSEGEYLVPLLYPTAKKLLLAAQSALEQGYQIKIYDSFRPREATLSIYNLAEGILQQPVPKQTFTGEPVKELEALSYQASTESEEFLMEGLTYEILMTDNGRYMLANFLALNISNHNLGVAMDITLQTPDGQELQMQTAIHDLSWYSEVSRNNENANLLKNIMVQAGFATLKSEWWHFQDDAIKSQLELKNLRQGITPQCWVLDDTGWRYRQKNGQYLTDCTETIDSVTYRFNEAGYVE